MGSCLPEKSRRRLLAASRDWLLRSLCRSECRLVFDFVGMLEGLRDRVLAEC